MLYSKHSFSDMVYCIYLNFVFFSELLTLTGLLIIALHILIGETENPMQRYLVRSMHTGIIIPKYRIFPGGPFKNTVQGKAIKIAFAIW